MPPSETWRQWHGCPLPGPGSDFVTPPGPTLRFGQALAGTH